MFTNNSKHCWMLHVASVCTTCCVLLGVFALSLKPVKLLNQQLPTFLLSVVSEAQRYNAASVCTALPTLLGPCTRITHGLQRLTGCNLPTMHCRSQHYWELFRPFAHHCQHERNNFRHCWPNNVGSCCIRLHVAFSSRTANIGPIVPALPDILSLKVATHQATICSNTLQRHTAATNLCSGELL